MKDLLAGIITVYFVLLYLPYLLAWVITYPKYDRWDADTEHDIRLHQAAGKLWDFIFNVKYILVLGYGVNK